MDPQSIEGRTESWVYREFAERDDITTEEVIEAVEVADLPDGAKWAVRRLPDDTWTTNSLAHAVGDMLEMSISAQARGIGNVPGPGGYGEQGGRGPEGY